MKAYDETVAEKYVARHVGPLRAYFDDQETRLLFEGINVAGKRVLDLGCGVGRLERGAWLDSAAAVIACDVSEPMLRVAARLHGSPGVYYCVMDAKRLAVPSRTVDIVVALGTFEGIADLATFLSEAHRVLRPGGILAFTCWNARRWYRFKMFDGRRPGSVDHEPERVVEQLDQSGFALRQLASTLYLPRRLFWIGNRLSPPLVRPLYVWICNAVANVLRSIVKMRGWLLLVQATRR